jgi:hypothetical protein
MRPLCQTALSKRAAILVPLIPLHDRSQTGISGKHGDHNDGCRITRADGGVDLARARAAQVRWGSNVHTHGLRREQSESCGTLGSTMDVCTFQKQVKWFIERFSPVSANISDGATML